MDFAPLITRLDAMRKPPIKPLPVKQKPPLTPFTPAEWSQVRAARVAAIKAHPEFKEQGEQTAARLKSFGQKLRAAMVQSDPQVAALLTKIGEPPQPSQPPSPPTPIKMEK